MYLKKRKAMKRITHMSPYIGIFLLVVCLLVTSGHLMAAPSCVPPPAGLVSWWDGDAVSGTTAKDIYGGNDGTLIGSVTTASGFVGNAFSFNGVDGKIVIANETAFDFTTQVSADAWVFISGGDGNYQSVVNKGYYSDGPFELRMTREGDPLPVLLGCPDKHVIYFAVTTINGLQNAGACITKGVWHHVAGTYDGTAVRFYLDGQITVSPNGTLGVVAQSGTLLQNNLPVSIGWNGSFGEVWAGLIDEVQIFNRALTAITVKSIFDAGTAGQCKATPFAAFTAQVKIERASRIDDAFELQSRFTLGAGSNGIDPLTEDMKLELTGGTGSFTTTIPAGSFSKDKQRRFEFEGTINGVNVQAKIAQLGGNQFKCEVQGEHADLTGLANPVTVTLTIGNDSGSTTVRAKFNHDDSDHGDGENGQH
jgi:hypothetical protein